MFRMIPRLCIDNPSYVSTTPGMYRQPRLCIDNHVPSLGKRANSRETRAISRETLAFVIDGRSVGRSVGHVFSLGIACVRDDTPAMYSQHVLSLGEHLLILGKHVLSLGKHLLSSSNGRTVGRSAIWPRPCGPGLMA